MLLTLHFAIKRITTREIQILIEFKLIIMAQILNMNQCIQSQSRIQYRLGYFLSLGLGFSTV